MISVSLKIASGQSSRKDAEPAAVEEAPHLGVVPRDLVEAVEARVAVDRGVGMDVVRAALVVAFEVRLHAAVHTEVILLEVCAAREESGEVSEEEKELREMKVVAGAYTRTSRRRCRSTRRPQHLRTAPPLSRLWHFEQQSSADTDSWQR